MKSSFRDVELESANTTQIGGFLYWGSMEQEKEGGAYCVSGPGLRLGEVEAMKF